MDGHDSNPLTAADIGAILEIGISKVSDGGPAPEVDIVFVHGLEGHPEKTWTEKQPDPTPQPVKSKRAKVKNALHIRSKAKLPVHESQEPPCFWPRDLLAKDFPQARIYTYGYDSRITRFFRGTTSTSNIHDQGRGLNRAVASIRSKCRGRPLIFIAHSLGGLVVKSSLKLSNDEDEANHDVRDINKSTIAVLFFGTPHRGSDWADMGSTMYRVVKSLGFSTRDLDLQLLTPTSDTLEGLRADFMNRLNRDKLRVTTFQEQKPCLGINGLDRLIVESGSSAIDHIKERLSPIEADHIGMCKFGRTGATNYAYESIVKPEVIWYTEGIIRAIDKSLDALKALYDDLNLRKTQIDTHHENTFSWLFNTKPRGPGFLPWLANGSHPIFWIQGLPGSGKSTAMKALTNSPAVSQTLKNAGWSWASMFLTDRIGQANRSWKGVLGAMLWKVLSQHNDKLLPILKPSISSWAPGLLLEKEEGGEPETTSESKIDFEWTVERLEEMLLKCKNQTEVEFSMCFFVDALDEYDKEEITDAKSIVRSITKLIGDSKGLGRFKICLASRPENVFDVHLRHYPGFKMQNWTRNDIEKVVYDQLLSHPDNRNPTFDQDQLKKICNTIIQSSEGLFIWVRLVVDDVYDGLTEGVLLSTIRANLQRVPRRLPQFYLHILKQRPVETMRETHAILEIVLRANTPVTVLDIGILLKMVRGRRSSDNPFKLSTNDLLDLSNSGESLEREIKRLTGGLLQILRPNWNAKPRGQISTGGEHHVVHAPTWRVQFLHQTVKESLLSKRLRKEMNTVLLNWPNEPMKYKLMDNGHVFHLQLASASLGLKPEAKTQSEWDMNPMKTVVKHAVGAEMLLRASLNTALRKLNPELPGEGFTYGMLVNQSLPGNAPIVEMSGQISSLFRLLTKLDEQCSRRSHQHDCWVVSHTDCQDMSWVPTFLAFAVWSNMQLFVAEALRTNQEQIQKDGRPLLHFAGYYPGLFPNPGMAKLLLDAGADPDARFVEKERKESKTALESIMYPTSEGEAAIVASEFIRLLVDRGAKVSTKALHLIAGLGASWKFKLDIIKKLPSHHKLNASNEMGKTVFERLIMLNLHDQERVEKKDIEFLLDCGARMTSALEKAISRKQLKPRLLDVFNSLQPRIREQRHRDRLLTGASRSMSRIRASLGV